MRARNLIAIAVLALACAATGARADLSAQQIVDRMEQQRRQIKDYTAEVTASFDMPQMRVAPMKVKVYYKHPDRIKAEPLSGFAILPKRGLTLQWPQPDLKGLQVEVSRVKLGGRPAYLLALKGAQPGSPAAGGRLWVDRERWVPLKFDIKDMERGGSFTVEAKYTRVDKRYWMPKRVEVDMTMPQAPKGKQKGNIKLEFNKYRVNTGLSDKIFEEKPKD